ncbi:MAG: hypothetical protein ABL888_10800 [Pirellulaceae bacterium]
MKIPCALICCLFFHPQHQDGYNWISADTTFDSAIVQRHVSPVVTIPGALPSSGINGGALSSAAQPGFVSVVPYGPMAVVVNTPVEITAVTGVELFLDGRAVDTSRFNRDQSNSNTYQFDFFCPSPGKHAVQARYLADNIWSNLSPPLFFQIRYPERPKIIALSDADSGDHGGPLNSEPVRITGKTIRLKLAQVDLSDFVDVYVDGEKINDQPVNASNSGSCCVNVAIANSLVPGIHEITVRSVPEGMPCSLASEASVPVKFHYYNECVYVLGPGSGFGSISQCKSDRKDAKNREKRTKNSSLLIERENIQISETQDDFLGPESEGKIPEPRNPDSLKDKDIPDDQLNSSFLSPKTPTYRVVSFTGKSSAILASAPFGTDDPEIQTAQNAKVDANKYQQQLADASTLLADIKDLKTTVDDTADETNYFAELSTKEFKRAHAAESAIPLEHKELRVSAKRMRLAAYKESENAKAINGLAHKLKNESNALSKKANEPATKIETVFAEVKRVRLQIDQHADRAIDLANKANDAKAAGKNQLENNLRAEAQTEATQAWNTALAVRRIADEASAHSDELRRIKSTLKDRLREIQLLKNQATQHADDAYQIALDSTELLKSEVAASKEFLENAKESVTKAEEAVKALAKKVERFEAAQNEKNATNAQNAIIEELEKLQELLRKHHEAHQPAHGPAPACDKCKREFDKLEGCLKCAQERLDQATIRKNNELQVAKHNALANRATAIANAAAWIDLDLDKTAKENALKRSFYFASAAQFPIREFGSQGQLIEKEGGVVYEDMVFTFDENGHYKINFDISTPILPTNLMLQFHVQSRQDGPWYTLTMPQRHIDPGDNGLREMHPIEFEGDSEILKRYFTSVCKVRRNGSAQFGFGLEIEEHQRTRFK